MSITCSVVTEAAVIEIVTRTHVEQIVLSGEHLSEFSDELSRAVRKAKRARLRAVTA